MRWCTWFQKHPTPAEDPPAVRQKWTVIAVVEGLPVPPYVEAESAEEAAVVAMAAVLSADDKYDPRQRVLMWRDVDGSFLDGAEVFAVIPGHVELAGGLVGYYARNRAVTLQHQMGGQ